MCDPDAMEHISDHTQRKKTKTRPPGVELFFHLHTLVLIDVRIVFVGFCGHAQRRLPTETSNQSWQMHNEGFKMILKIALHMEHLRDAHKHILG